jgi:large subunit ribosomal protein L21
MTLMYAVIDAGGKQERVEVGQLVDVDLLRAAPGDELTLEALLVVDGAQVAATPEALAGSTVSARVVGEALGPKIVGFKYKKKTRSRKRWGHRQHYTTLEITGIDSFGKSERAEEPAEAVAETATVEPEAVEVEVEAVEAEAVEAEAVEVEAVEAESPAAEAEEAVEVEAADEDSSTAS